MKKFYTLLLVFIVAAGSSLMAQRPVSKIEAGKIMNGKPANKNNSNTVTLNRNNTSVITIYRDGNGNTGTGYAYNIYITPSRVTRHAGEEDGTTGIIDTYTESDTQALDKAIKLINSYRLTTTQKRRPSKAVRGKTQISVSNGNQVWLELTQSPSSVNFNGDLDGLVDRLVEMVGGEPTFGGPLVPYPDPEIDPHIIDPDYPEIYY